MELGIFTFNPFQENTYILYDETGECVIIDPGCSNNMEQEQLTDFISANELKPVRLINTHCHIDHILGNRFINEHYNIGLEIHAGEQIVLDAGTEVSGRYGIPYQPIDQVMRYISDNEIIEFGNTKLKALFTPGHSPASLSFFNEETNLLIAGDVLFYESIGRTDLPGGSLEVLLRSINERLMVLPEDVQVYPGHGPKTTIGHERVNNSFLRTF